MIPKVIHYCWFGGKPLPPLAKKCLKSWKKHCPNYEIKRWDESNFDINMCRYVKEAYEAKKYAFVTDFVRLWALVKFGGIYMDTDVEVLKSLDPILQYKAVSGFEKLNIIPTGLMACEKGFPLFEEFLRDYDNLPFLLPDGKQDLTPNVIRMTNICLKYGLIANNTEQTVNGFKLFPMEYFCPVTYNGSVGGITNNTFTIHHFMSSWCKTSPRWRIYLFMTRFLGAKNTLFIKNQWSRVKHCLMGAPKTKW